MSYDYGFGLFRDSAGYIFRINIQCFRVAISKYRDTPVLNNRVDCCRKSQRAGNNLVTRLKCAFYKGC